jgi:Flp pilus assembly protein TadG
MLKSSHPIESREAGQAIILIVFAFIGLLVAVGLVVDLGRVLVVQTQLRRAVDAAALAGAAQFRLSGSSSTPADVYGKVDKAARAALRVSGVSTQTLDCPTCTIVDTEYTDATMHTDPPTKKVRVRVTEDVPLIFISLVGLRSVQLNADSTTEAAAVDVALLIDISDSMANDTCGGGNYQCVYDCDNVADPGNNNTACHPFLEVKAAAKSFLDYLYPGYDRVTVIPFGLYAGYCINDGDTWPDCAVSAYDPAAGKFGDKYVPLTTDLGAARVFIENLDIAVPDWASDVPGERPHDPPWNCPSFDQAGDPRECTNTNVGGGVRAGATELLKEFDPLTLCPLCGPNHPAKERLRVIILLTDGAANASGLGAEGGTYGTPDGLGDPNLEDDVLLGYCPRSTWVQPFCRAASPGFAIAAGRHISTSVDYDAVDYTLDWADFAMLDSPTGNSIVMFTIGLGNLVTDFTAGGDADIGERVLRYIAAGGDDANLATDPCAGAPVATSCGNYYFAPSGGELLDIFRAIAGRIFTRINQ